MIKILVIEDSDVQRKNLCSLLSKINSNLKIYEASTKDGALEISKKTNIDLFFVDIELKDSSGIDFATEIRKVYEYKYTLIVFVTAYINYIIKAFKEVHCYDYLIKPYNSNDIRKIINIITENTPSKNIQQNKPYVLINQNSIEIKLFLDEIIFIETSMGKCTIHTIIGKYVMNRMTLKKLLKIINCDYIIQCHRSCAVNIKYIRKIEKYSQVSWNIYFDKYKYCAFMGSKYKEKIINLLKVNSVISQSII